MNPSKSEMQSRVWRGGAAGYAGLLSLFLSGACGGSHSEDDFDQAESANNPTTANGGATNRGGSGGSATGARATTGGTTSVSPPSGGTAQPLAGAWSGSVSSLGTRVTRTRTFTADGSPIFVCDDGTQTTLTSVGQTFRCVDSWLSGGSERLTLVVLRLVRQQTRVEFDLEVQIPGGIRIGTTINGPGTITELGRDVFYQYTFVLSGNQLTYTVENDASNVIETGVLTKR
jgi:hypothetical protein